MFILVYPPEPAAIQGSMPDELFPIVEPSGLVVGRATRSYCHGGSMLLHPVVHLHIIDRKGRIYLQKRGASKDLYPGRWDTAVGGHVGYCEQIEEALYREAGEELGFTDFNPIYLRSYEFQSIREREMVNVFASISAKTPHPDGYEVERGRWFTQAEIMKAVGSGVFTPNFESEYLNIKDSLMALL